MGIFDNATSVVIGNKEVQSIIGPNGEVFYQKHSVDITLSEPLDSILIHQVTNPDISSIIFVPAQEVADYFQDGPVTVNYLNNHQNQEIIAMIREEAFTMDDVTNYTFDFYDMNIDLADYDLTNIPLFAPVDGDLNVYRVEYTATDSTHLTITITNDIISE